jgi:transcriptional regulator with XRE-family HTH domain
VARRIKGKRIALGLAEIDVAAVLGVEDGTIEAYERGTEPVPPEHLTRLSEYFGVPLGYFLPAVPRSLSDLGMAARLGYLLES